MLTQKQLKSIAVDVLGVVIIILGVFVGLLPGPGGIFFYLIGLGLLAKNHTWASRLLDDMKRNGTRLFRRFFVQKNKSIQLLFDLLGLVLLGLGVWFVTFRGIWISVGSVFGFLGISLLGANRERLSNLFKKK